MFKQKQTVSLFSAIIEEDIFMAEKIDYSKGIYDAKQLGTPKMLILGAQHMFAMFGATVLVPLLTGLSVSTTLLFAGLARCCSTSCARARSLHSWAPALPTWAALPS